MDSGKGGWHRARSLGKSSASVQLGPLGSPIWRIQRVRLCYQRPVGGTVWWGEGIQSSYQWSLGWICWWDKQIRTCIQWSMGRICQCQERFSTCFQWSLGRIYRCREKFSTCCQWPMGRLCWIFRGKSPVNKLPLGGSSRNCEKLWRSNFRSLGCTCG